MEINLSADQPVKKSAEDKFQRYNFSKSIADTIKNRKSEECIVVVSMAHGAKAKPLF